MSRHESAYVYCPVASRNGTFCPRCGLCHVCGAFNQRGYQHDAPADCTTVPRVASCEPATTTRVDIYPKKPCIRAECAQNRGHAGPCDDGLNP